MGNNIVLSIAIVFMFLAGILILWIKSSEINSENTISKIKRISLLPKILVSLLLIFCIMFIVTYAKSTYNLPKISNISSEYYDSIDIGDGIVVVGRTRLSVSDPNESSHHYENTRSYIVKYDYDGELIWDDVYYIEDKVDESSTFSSVYVNDDGNIVASGTFGGYYDGYSLGEVIYSPNGEVVSFSQINYEVHSILPKLFRNGDIISFTYSMLEYESTLSEINVNFDSIDNDRDNNYIIQYQHDVITEYTSWEPRVSVVYSDDDHVVVGITVLNVRDILVFNNLYIFDRSLNYVDEINLPDEILAGEIQMYDDQLYMLSMDDKNRKSYLVLLDNDFSVSEIQPIETNLEHFVARDIIFDNDLIYIGGSEYETRTKEGFVEYFSGVINVYSLDLVLEERIYMKTGVGINQMLIVDEQIYTTGLFNTSIGLDSNDNYAWCGVFSVVDSDKQNYVLAFTHRKLVD